MSNPLKDYRDFVRANLPSGITYNSTLSRYFHNSKRFLRYAVANRYKEYLEKFDGASAAAPTIAITSGSGYIGSTYTATTGDGSTSGQWKAGGVDISGETGLTYTMGAANEGAAITFVQGDSQESDSIELWVPADLVSLEAHWDPKDASTITESLSMVSAVADKANSFNLVQASGALQPELTGADGLSFVEQYMNTSASVTGVRSMFFVSLSANGSNVSSAVCPVIGETTASADATFLRTNNTDYTISIDGNLGTNGDAGIDGQLTLTAGTDIDFGLSNAGYLNPHIWSVEWDSGQDIDYVGRFNTGSQFFATATYGEFVITTAILSEADRRRVEGYLQHRWDTPTLPSGHPYETDAPRAA